MIRDRREAGVLGHKERNQLELFITGSLRQLIPDDHVLVRVDRILDLSWLRGEVSWRGQDMARTRARRQARPRQYEDPGLSDGRRD
jgi:hypothetical protein